MAQLQPFHLAFPVLSLSQTYTFYTDALGCKVGRQAERWIDFDFFGHQISAHLVDELPTSACNNVDGDQVPAHHFGVVLAWDAWQLLATHLQELEITFIIEPKIRFKGQVGEQATMFFLDPCGNALEFKSFKDPSALFKNEN